MRDKIMDFLRAELVGPDPIPPDVQDNGEEILVTDPPRLRYGAGVLFPQGVSAEKSEDVESAETTGVEVEVDSEETHIEDREGGENQETIEDQNTEEITALTNSYLPSAIGFSCLATLPKAGFLVEVKAGTYHAEPREYTTKSGEMRTGRKYLRTQLDYVLEVLSSDLEGEDIRTWKGDVKNGGGEDVNLQLRILSRPRPPGDDGSLYRAVNRRHAPAPPDPARGCGGPARDLHNQRPLAAVVSSIDS